jgi:hypothetical protein
MVAAAFRLARDYRGLRNRLNMIPGVTVPPVSLARRPSFEMALLKERTSLSQFFDAVEWFLEAHQQFRPANMRRRMNIS